MGYLIKVCDSENGMQEIINPPSDATDRAIDKLFPGVSNFIVLEHEEPIKNCLYIQTLATCEDDFIYEEDEDETYDEDGDDETFESEYLLEAHFEYDGHFKHFQTFITDIDYLKSVFRKFATGIVPDVEGWDDITTTLTKMGK